MIHEAQEDMMSKCETDPKNIIEHIVHRIQRFLERISMAITLNDRISPLEALDEKQPLGS